MIIVPIGGGNLAALETLPIDRGIVGLTGKRRPRALFVPTASGDDADYCAAFSLVYGSRLGCRVDTLLLCDDPPPAREIRDKLARADLIYVGGGNTLKMMRRWRRLGVDRGLRAAAKRGAVLCGLSAGAICWFDFGHSDSMSFYDPEDWDYIRVRCLGLIPATGCPHYNAERRCEPFEEMIGKRGGIGIAVDNHCAIVFENGTYRVLSCRKGSGAYRLRRSKGTVETKSIRARRPEPVIDLLLS